MGRRTAQLLLLAGTAAGCALAAEWAVRHVFRAAPQLHVDIYRKDDAGLLLLRPELVRRHVTPQWDVEIRTQADGFRDHDDPPTASQPVVLALGDSQAFGWGVELNQSFYSIAEKYIDARIIKAAVPGTGPWDYLRTLELLGPRVKPQLAVVAVFIGNDFSDAARGEAGARYEVDDGLLITPGQTSWRDRLARRSHLLQLVRAWQFNSARSGAAAASRERIWDDRMREFAEIHLRSLTPRADHAYSRMLQSLDAIESRSSEMSVDLALLLVPRSWQVSISERRSLQRALGYRDADLDLDRPQRGIRDWGAARGVAVWDLPKSMLAGESDEDLFFTPDAHLNPEGHRRMGAALTEGLRRWIRESATIESNPGLDPAATIDDRGRDGRL